MLVLYAVFSLVQSLIVVLLIVTKWQCLVREQSACLCNLVLKYYRVVVSSQVLLNVFVSHE